MIAIVDVHYEPELARAGCVLARDFADAEPAAMHVATTGTPAEYRPGEFWRRELPPILAVLAKLDAPPHVVVVDGYVWLGPKRPGLGAHLHEALGEKVPVIGVAKTAFRGAVDPMTAIEVRRGRSDKPLFVTAVGCDVMEAARDVAAMDGPNRIPTLLRLADTLARGRTSGAY